MNVRFVARLTAYALVLCGLGAIGGTSAWAQAQAQMQDVKEVTIQDQTPPPPASVFRNIYLESFGGAVWSTGYGNRSTTLASHGASLNATPNAFHTGLGATGGLLVGYKLGEFPVAEGLSLCPSVEGEAFYLGSSNNGPLGGGLGINQKMDMNSAAWFASGAVRFKLAFPVTPYVGFGVGGQYITANTTLSTPKASTQFDSDCLDFAIQLKAGVEYEIVPHWSVFTEYRFIDAFNTDLHAASGSTSYSFTPDQLTSQVANAGIKYNF